MEDDRLLEEGTTPDGEPVTLTLESGHYVVRIRHESLMSSDAHGSEQLMAELSCRPLALHEGARVMIGGLGNPLGPLVAGAVIGVSEAVTMALTAPAWAPLVSFSLLIVVLLARAKKF